MVAIMLSVITNGSEAKVCAGCPAQHEGVSSRDIDVARSAVKALRAKEENAALLNGGFDHIIQDSYSTQVVAGIWHSFEIETTTDQHVKIKVFQNLPDAHGDVKMDVQEATIMHSPTHRKGLDIIIEPVDSERDDNLVNEKLHCDGVYWTETS